MGFRIRHFHCPETATLSYLAWDDRAHVGVVIDPSVGAERALLAAIDELGLAIPLVLETHLHMDHVSCAPSLRRRCGARVAIGARVRELGVLLVGRPVADVFDDFLEDGDTLAAGPLDITAFDTPGHTGACVSYRIEDALFVGDLLLRPERGTGRCDFLGGSADALFDSVYRIYRDLPDGTRVFPGHAYGADRDDLRPETTLWEQRARNVLLNAFTSRREFAGNRAEADARLGVPRGLVTSVAANLEGTTVAPDDVLLSEEGLRAVAATPDAGIGWNRRLRLA